MLRPFLTSLALIAAFGASGAHPDYITYDNKRIGSPDKPYIIRTYLPNPDLEDVVLSHHGRGFESPSYSPNSGLLSTRGTYKPIKVIPAAISVSYGDRLAYAWDTTECRLLYAWANGFLDMESHWGAPGKGGRSRNSYDARLFGQLFYKAKGQPPLQINGKPHSNDVRYLGNSRKGGHPTFRYSVDGRTISVDIRPGKAHR
jgi:hypothetical protein